MNCVKFIILLEWALKGFQVLRRHRHKAGKCALRIIPSLVAEYKCALPVPKISHSSLVIDLGFPLSPIFSRFKGSNFTNKQREGILGRIAIFLFNLPALFFLIYSYLFSDTSYSWSLPKPRNGNAHLIGFTSSKKFIFFAPFFYNPHFNLLDCENFPTSLRSQMKRKQLFLPHGSFILAILSFS